MDPTAPVTYEHIYGPLSATVLNHFANLLPPKHRRIKQPEYKPYEQTHTHILEEQPKADP